MLKREHTLSYIGWLLIVVGIVLQQQWMFGLFFLIWTIQDIRNGQAYIFSNVKRNESPIFYWFIIITWFVVSGLYLVPFGIRLFA